MFGCHAEGVRRTTIAPRWSEQVEYLLNRNGLSLGHLRQNPMKRADLERVVLGNRDRVSGRRFVKKPYVASLLADYFVAEFLQSANQFVGRNAARQLHAASIAINSSFTKCN